MRHGLRSHRAGVAWGDVWSWLWLRQAQGLAARRRLPSVTRDRQVHVVSHIRIVEVVEQMPRGRLVLRVMPTLIGRMNSTSSAPCRSAADRRREMAKPTLNDIRDPVWSSAKLPFADSHWCFLE
jgi:hypothetical protein